MSIYEKYQVRFYKNKKYLKLSRKKKLAKYFHNGFKNWRFKKFYFQLKIKQDPCAKDGGTKDYLDLKKRVLETLASYTSYSNSFW